MKPSRTLRISVVIFYMVLMFSLSSIPGQTLASMDIPFYDKLLHLIEYTIFGVIASWALVVKPELSEFPRRLVAVLILGCGYAFIDEMYQYFVPERSSDILDFAADVAGIILGLTLYLIYNKWISRLRSVS